MPNAPTDNSALLSTRCPHCGTLFKVIPDQLRVADGWVRCGQCQEAFVAEAHALPVLKPIRSAPAAPQRQPEPQSPHRDAFDGDDNDAASPAPSSAALPPPVMPAWLAGLSLDLDDLPPSSGKRLDPRTDVTSGAVASPDRGRNAADDPAVYGGDIEVPDFLARQWGGAPAAEVLEPLPAAGVQPLSAPLAVDATQPVSVVESNARIEPVLSSAAESAPEGEPVAQSIEAPTPLSAVPPLAEKPGLSGLPISMVADEDVTPELRSRARQLLPEATPLHGETAAVAREHAIEPLSPAGPSPLQLARRARNARLAKAAWTAAALLLAWVLLSQVASRFYPAWVAQQGPGVRGALTWGCLGLGGCQPSAAGLPDNVVITSSKLDRREDGAYVLSFELDNRAPYQQDLPGIELSLLDAAGQPALRRRLSIRDLPQAPARLPAGGRWRAEAVLDIDAAQVPLQDLANYRLRLYSAPR